MMKTSPHRLWASLMALSQVPALLAESTTTTTASPTSVTEEAKCQAELVTKICDYADPFRAVASSGRSHCWNYCNENQPCDFVIFVPGNPTLGTGTCWVYPGDTYDESLVVEDCSNAVLEVYSKPKCEGPSTTTEGHCAATASPSAVASVCGYPAPENCFEDCIVSSGSADCLSLCVEHDSCNYAVFNPIGETNSPYESGNCWIFAEGKYDAEAVEETCGSDGPEQYVYSNPCPKPKPTTTSSSATTATQTGDDESETGNSDESNEGEDDDDEGAAASVSAALSLTTLFAAGLAFLL